MGILCYILGRSGTGKSYSLRDFPKDKLAVINVQGKILPFKGSGQIEMTSTDTSKDIVKALENYGRQYKSIVVDDFQYVMANEFMRRSTERGYDKFTEIGRHAWDIANTVRSLPADCIVYVMCHTDRDDDGNEKIKTIGKLLDEKICLEGMSTIVLMTNVTDGVYTFLTQNNGKNTVKSPAGMFPSYAIDNDLHYVDQKIRTYYELGDFLTAEEEAEIDEAAKRDDIPINDGKKERKKRGKKKEEEPAETSQEEEKKEAAEAPEPKKRRRKVSDEMKEEREAVQKENAETVANAGLEEAGDDEEIPFTEVETPEVKELPKRKSRKKAAPEEALKPLTATNTQYWKGPDGNIMVINKGDTIPSPSEGWHELTKDQYETAIKDMSLTETPEGGRRRRRRRTAE